MPKHKFVRLCLRVNLRESNVSCYILRVVTDIAVILLFFMQKFIGVSVSEFSTRWRTWNAECKRLLDERAFIVEPNLHTVLRV